MKGAGEITGQIEHWPKKHEDLGLSAEATLKTAGRQRQAELGVQGQPGQPGLHRETLS